MSPRRGLTLVGRVLEEHLDELPVDDAVVHREDMEPRLGIHHRHGGVGRTGTGGRTTTRTTSARARRSVPRLLNSAHRQAGKRRRRLPPRGRGGVAVERRVGCFTECGGRRRGEGGGGYRRAAQPWHGTSHAPTHQQSRQRRGLDRPPGKQDPTGSRARISTANRLHDFSSPSQSRPPARSHPVPRFCPRCGLRAR